MHFSLSFLALLVTVGAASVHVRGGGGGGGGGSGGGGAAAVAAAAAARNLSQVTSPVTTLAPTLTNSNGSNEEVCFQGFKNAAEEQLAELLINQLLGKPTSDYAAKYSGFPKVSRATPGVPFYSVGCSIFDFKCMECSLCEGVYEALIGTGSEVACDAACIAIVEVAGAGPEDPIADIVAAACIPLCAAIFESAVPSAHTACSSAHLCSS